MDVPSRADLYAIGRDYVVTRSKKIDPAQVDIEGSDANLYCGLGSVLATQVMRQLVYRTSVLLLDGADDEDLDRLIYDRYSLTRKGASPARGEITITRPTAIAGAGSVPIGTKLTTDLGYEYITTTVATFSAGALTADGPCDVRATQAGKATQAAAGTINRFAKPQSLWDATLIPRNAAATAGGEETESNELFRERARDFWRTARRGILAAIEIGAKTVEGVVSAVAVEALTGGATPARVVNLYISDSTGVASRALADEVAVVLNDWRAAGIAVLIHTSAPTLVDIELDLRFVAGVDTKTLRGLVRGAVFEFVNSLPVNGTLYTSEIRNVLLRYKDQGLLPDEGSIVTPAGDLVPDVGQTIRTTLDRVTEAA